MVVALTEWGGSKAGRDGGRTPQVHDDMGGRTMPRPSGDGEYADLGGGQGPRAS